MAPGYEKCIGQSCIDEIMTVYALHLDKMEELENNFLQLDIWETETREIIVEKEKLRIEALIKDIFFLTTNIDEEILEFEYMEEIALQIREAELWHIEGEFMEIYGIEEVNGESTVTCEKDSMEIGQLNIYIVKKILDGAISKNKYRIALLNYVYLLNDKTKIRYHDRYVTT